MNLSPSEWQALALSLRVSLVASLISLPFGVLLAAWLARSRSRLRWLVDAFVQIPLVLPPLVTGYLLLLLLGRRGPLGKLLAPLGIEIAFDWKGAALAAAVVSFPLLVRAAKLALARLAPQFRPALYKADLRATAMGIRRHRAARRVQRQRLWQ